MKLADLMPVGAAVAGQQRYGSSSSKLQLRARHLADTVSTPPTHTHSHMHLSNHV